MSSRCLPRAVLLSLVPAVALVLASGCTRSSAPSPEASSEPAPEAAAELEIPEPPAVEAPAAPVEAEPNPSVAEDRSQQAVSLEEPAMQAEPALPEVEQAPSADLAATSPAMPPVESAVLEPPMVDPPVRGPIDEEIPEANEFGLRPNPLREGEVPESMRQVVSRQEPLVPVKEATESALPKRSGKHGEGSFDPIKENGPIFVGWPKPAFALAITGRQDGYLEPCGCAGLDRMKGGLTRRYSMFEQLRNDGWDVVGVDVGGQCKSFGRQAVLKYQMSVDALKQMGYSAVAYGANDLRLPAGEVLAVTAAIPGQESPFISANVALFGFAAEMTPKKRIVEAGGKKIGVTAVLGKKFQQQLNNPDIEMIAPEEALESLVPELKKECDLLVLLAHATLEESIELGKRFPDFKVVVTYGGPPEPPPTPKTIEGTDNLLIEVGEKGMNAVVLGFYDDPVKPIRYQRVPLDSRFADAPEMKLLMRNYQTQLRSEGLEGLGLRPVPHPKKELQGKFVGSHKCEVCHEASYEVWKKSGHAKAWETLKNLEIPRDADPECISCHVVGWHGTQYFPYESGFWSEAETPKLVDVGCESCHGPGEKHIEAEMGSDTALQKKLQEAMVVTKEESEKRQCYSCHDLDNSPDFDFKTYWPLVEHYEE